MLGAFRGARGDAPIQGESYILFMTWWMSEAPLGYRSVAVATRCPGIPCRASAIGPVIAPRVSASAPRRTPGPRSGCGLKRGIIYGSAQAPNQSGRGTVTTSTGSRIVRNASSGVISGRMMMSSILDQTARESWALPYIIPLKSMVALPPAMGHGPLDAPQHFAVGVFRASACLLKPIRSVRRRCRFSAFGIPGCLPLPAVRAHHA